MRPIAVIQARTGSQRLPGKVLMPLGSRTVLDYVVMRCRQSRRLGEVVVATTVSASDDAVCAAAERLDVPFLRGPDSDVLARYLKAADEFDAEDIMRITADCPLIDPTVIDAVVDLDAADYAAYEGYPNGVGAAELVRVSALRRAAAETTPADQYYREHVTTYFVDHPEKFRVSIASAPAPCRRPELRLSIDEAADLDVVRHVCAHFGERLDFTTGEIIAFLDEHPEVAALNANVRQKTR
jgi:spore coat polysaccharide biosynthesis protein SpsF